MSSFGTAIHTTIAYDDDDDRRPVPVPVPV